MVRFRDGKPIGIWYSQHVSGAAYDWNHKALSKEDERVCCASASLMDVLQANPFDSLWSSAHTGRTRIMLRLGEFASSFE